MRTVMELAGIKNAFGKQLGSSNPLNNARATVDGLSQMRTFEQRARDRGLSVGEMLVWKPGKPCLPPPPFPLAPQRAGVFLEQALSCLVLGVPRC